MSGEFGSCCSGYLHTQMEYAASDLEEGELRSTRIWAGLFSELHKITEAICWAEASDSSETHSICTAIDRLPIIKQRLAEIEAFYRPYSEIAERAVRDAIHAHEAQEQS